MGFLNGVRLGKNPGIQLGGLTQPGAHVVFLDVPVGSAGSKVIGFQWGRSFHPKEYPI